MRIARWLWLVLAPLVPLAQSRVDARLGTFRAQNDVLYLWSGDQIRRLVPGLEDLMADVYWLRTVQYYGGQRAFAREKRFELLEPLVTITTTLDPRLEIAYRYGAIFLAESWPTGAGRPDAGAKLLERGVRNLPNSWRLRQDLGYFYFYFLDDPRKAADVLLEARRLPGAPYWLETMAASILAQGGERQVARQMWRRLYEQAEEGVLKRNAERHLQYLDALDLADRLAGVVQEFARRNGRRPRTLEELRQIGWLPAIPTDPTGTPFLYDPETGTVSISRQSTLWREEPPRPGA